MTYRTHRNDRDFNKLVQMGLRRAQAERSKAFFALFDRIAGAGRKPVQLSDG